jgi:hypothetical protein
VTTQEHIQAIIDRSKAFYSAIEPGHFLIQTRFPHDRPDMPDLTEFDLEHDLERWLDHQLACCRVSWAAKTGVDDDTMPCVCPRFGIAEHTAWLGAEVRFQRDTCLPVPIIHNKEDLRRLQLSEQTKWFQIMRRGYAYLKSKLTPEFVLSVRGGMSPMEMANALRGDDLFMDFYDDPEFAHEMMRFFTKAELWYYERLRSWVEPIQGGYASFLADFWFPAGLAYLTNDAALLCNAEIYREFALPYEREICSKFPHTLYHVHNEKMHFVPMVATLPGLRLLQISWDPKTTPQMEDLNRLFSVTGNVPLMLHSLSSDQVRDHITELSQRNVFLLVDCADVQDAQDILAFVRSRSKPLV